MNLQNRKSIYMWSMCIGGIGGLLFLVCFFLMFYIPMYLSNLGNVTFQKLYNFVTFVSLPIFYLIELFIDVFRDEPSMTSIKLGLSLFILYWAILGMAIAFGLVRIYFFIFRKRQPISNMSLPENKEE
jgi:hypothetical protein